MIIVIIKKNQNYIIKIKRVLLCAFGNKRRYVRREILLFFFSESLIAYIYNACRKKIYD